MGESTFEKPRILIVDDEVWIREYLSEVLREGGYEIEAIGDDAESLKKIETGPYDLIITDINMPRVDGFHVLKIAKSQSYRPEVLLITGQGSTQSAVRAVKYGAFDYLVKPIDSTRIGVTIEQALERGRLKAEISRLQAMNGQGPDTEITDEHLFFFDMVTGLPNRTLFFDRLEQGIKRQKQQENHLAILLLDIDGFSRINEAYGSDIADQILSETARRLEEAVFERDTIARIGNDEFGIIAEIKKEPETLQLIEKLMASTSDTLSIGGQDILLSLSIGVSFYPIDGGNAALLMNNARSALRIAKQTGRGVYQFFTPGRHRRVKELISMELLLSKSVEKNEFSLHFQPYYELDTMRPAGMEALLRLESDLQKPMGPAQFIPILEETKLIIQVGEWVTYTVCDFINRHLQLSLPVAMNISAIQLQRKEYIDNIIQIIKTHCVQPSFITIELTESVFIQELFDLASEAIGKFKDIGCSISIDDFGTGYSSMSYLKNFPFDILKIDMSFIREIETNRDDRTIVSAITAMAKEFQLCTIAEGVETEEQLGIIKSIGCDISQGYYHAKPMPEEDLLVFLQNARQLVG